MKQSLVISLFMLIALFLSRGLSGDDTLVKTLDNGLLVVVREHKAAPVVSVNVIVKTGGIYENEYMGKGISHFLEHLVSGGPTPERTEEQTDLDVDKIGGQTNAYTSADHTLYFISTASEYFDTALDILSGYIQNVIIDQFRFDREKAVIEKEINMGEDEPSRVIWKLYNQTAFVNAPVKIPNIGYRELEKSVTIDEIKTYHDRTYIPNNSIVLVVGDVDKEETFEKVKKAFENWERKSYIKPILPAEPPQTHPKWAEKEMDTKVTYLRIGYHTVELTHPDLYPLDILSYILTNGKSSRFFRKIKEEKKLVYSIDSWSITPSYGYGIFMFNCVLNYDKVKETVSTIHNDLMALKDELVTPDELEQAKNQKIADNAFEKETAASMARQMTYSLAGLEDPYFNDTYTENIQKVTAEDIRSVVRKYFYEDNQTVAVVKPLGAEKSIKGTAGEKEEEIGKVKKVILDNGATVLFKRNPTTPTVAIQAHFRGGIRYENDETNGISNFMVKTMIKGTKELTGVEIASDLENKGGSINTYTMDNNFGVKIDLLSKDIELGIKILADVVKNPKFSEESLDLVRDEVISEIKKEDDDWQWEGINFFNQIRYEKHPYRLPRYGTVENVNKFKSKDLKRFHKKFCVPSNMVITIFGDIDIDASEKLAAEYFDKMRGPKYEVGNIPIEPKVVNPRTKEKKTLKSQSVITYGYEGIAYRNKDLYALRIVDAITSGINLPGGWLHKALRGEKDLVYFVHLMLWNSVDPGSIIILTQCQPENTEQVISLIEETMSRAIKGEFTNEELESAKKIAITSELIYYQTNSLLASRAALYELCGVGYGYMDDYKERINEVTLEDLVSVSKKFFKNPVLAIIKPDSESTALSNKPS
ncbi:insulinase family protein [bacterium]|nr:insulinase family protein [bacterium]